MKILDSPKSFEYFTKRKQKILYEKIVKTAEKILHVKENISFPKILENYFPANKTIEN